ncbi:MAG TPA: phage baseplate protein, partial [Blastocatellia bacterium]
MKPLSAHDIVRIWELGLAQGPIDRALTILAPAFPELAREEIARLSLGQLNARLFDVRERLLGPDLNCYAECPRCRERLEFTIAVSAIRSVGPVVPEGQQQEMSIEGLDLRFRLLNSLDLKALTEATDKGAMRRLLAARCVLDARREGEEIPRDQLPETVITALAARLSECDPDAEVLLDLECPSCKNGWQTALDIVGFFWNELSAQVKRLLSEV